MYYLTNAEGKIIGYSTSKVNPAMEWTDDDIVVVGSKMFFASQTEDIDNAKKEYEQAETIRIKIDELKQELKNTDYKCMKFVDGALTEEEYAEVRAYRAELRRKINELTDE